MKRTKTTIQAAAKYYALCIMNCALISALCITSCTSDDQTADTTLRPIEFNATGINALGSTRSTVDGNWEDAGSVAVMIDGEVKPYTVSDGKLTSTAPFYWDGLATTKSVTAWYPYKDGDTPQPTAADIVKKDQSEKANYLASDLLTATKEITYNGNNTLEFAHQMARITITVTDGILNAKQDATKLTILSGYAPYHTGTGVYDILLAPQTIDSGTELFTLLNADGILIYAVPSDLTLVANQHLTYNVTLTLDGMEVTSVSDTNGWTSGGEESVESIDISKYNEVVYLSKQSGTYKTQNANVLIVGDGNTYCTPIVVSSSTTNVTLFNAKLSVSDGNPITCEGNVTITLIGENVVNTKSDNNFSAIYIADGKTMIIEGTDNLAANSKFGAGIGGNSNNDGGNIIINSGNVSATSEFGAGIGAGVGNEETKSGCGTITINGGTITATSEHGAGIGAGNNNSSCDTITINGGTITATSKFGTGIGAGTMNSECGDIYISGSSTSVTAKGEVNIGAGSDSTCGTVTIKDGATVNNMVYN